MWRVLSLLEDNPRLHSLSYELTAFPSPAGQKQPHSMTLDPHISLRNGSMTSIQ